MCLWQALKLWKMQLEVRSFNVTWSRDLWGHRVIVFWKCVKLLAEQLWQIWRLQRKNLRADTRPPAVRGLIRLPMLTLAVTRHFAILHGTGRDWYDPLAFSFWVRAPIQKPAYCFLRHEAVNTRVYGPRSTGDLLRSGQWPINDQNESSPITSYLSKLESWFRGERGNGDTISIFAHNSA